MNCTKKRFLIRLGCIVAVLLGLYSINALMVSHLQKDLDASLAEASHIGDSFDAAFKLNAAIDASHATCRKIFCDEDLKKTEDNLISIRDSLLVSAVARGDNRAIELAFDEKRAPANIRFKAQMLLPVLAELSNPSAETLRLAGEMYAEGNHISLDYKHAYVLLTKAWSQGNTQAAGSLAKLFEAMNDNPNAYLWSLRCRGSSYGERCYGQQDAARAKLEGSQILRIQAMARFNKIMTVGTTPLAPHSDAEDSK